MAEDADKIRINVRAFVDDFTRGASEEELGRQYVLTHDQMLRVVGVLERRGNISSKEIALRKENLKIRFGESQGSDQSPREEKIAVDLDAGLVLHCPACGASVKRDAEECEYCHAHLDFSLKGKTSDCPHCFQRIPAESRFCVRCGRPVPAEVPEGQELADRLCPRCQATLVGRRIADFSIMGCDGCGGMFVSHQTFEMMQDASDRVILTTGRAEQGRMMLEKKITYARCPVCRTIMNRKNFAGISGVVVDICGYHGIWFDSGEMDKIMDFVAHGGLQKARVREAEERLWELNQQAQIRNEEAIARGTVIPPLMSSYHEHVQGSDLIRVLGDVFKVFKE